MRPFIIITIVIVLLLSFSLFVNGKKQSPPAHVHKQISKQINALEDWYKKDWTPALETENERALQQSFARGRQLYKEAEWAVEYFFPATAKELNGAPLPEIEAEEHIIIPPVGFQVMEELIYPYEVLKKLELQQESKKWFSILTRLRTLWQGHSLRDDQIPDAVKQHIQRITALGLSGFDTPLSLTAIAELPYSLKGIQKALRPFENNTLRNEFAALQTLFEKGITRAKAVESFDAFNRMDFILNVLNPLSRQVSALQQKLRMPQADWYAVKGSAATFFDSGAFNPDFFTPDALSHGSAEKIELGKRLFQDVLLSSDGTVSCASCHKPELAFTDGLERSRSFGAMGFLKRNTPTLLYAGLQQGQFYDMRAPFLEDQVKSVVDNKDEIHGSLPEAARKLSRSMGFLKSFQKAFNTQADTITEVQIQIALAAYVRSLAPFKSRFDRHMRGGKTLTPDETAGFNLFMGKAKCGTCHFVPLFNGTAPPFTNTESEVIGVPADAAVTTLDPDPGRYGIHRLDEFRGAFKTPTLRNVARTAPYMHNGAFATLEQVIDFYNNGGAAGAHIELEAQTLPPDSLQLTGVEKRALISFLRTLTDAP